MLEIKDPAELQNLKDEEVVELYWQTIQQIEDLEGQKSAIKTEVDARLQDRKRNTLQFGDSDVTRYPKVYTNKVTIETAREFGATKTEEKILGPILTKLHKSGIKIDGISERWEVRITKIEKEVDEA